MRRATGELASSTVSSAVLFLLDPGREVLRKATLVNAEPCIRSWSATLRRVCSAVAESDCSIGSSRDFGEVGDRDVCGLLAPAELSCDSLPPSVPGHAASEAPCRNSSTGPRHFLGPRLLAPRSDMLHPNFFATSHCASRPQIGHFDCGFGDLPGQQETDRKVPNKGTSDTNTVRRFAPVPWLTWQLPGVTQVAIGEREAREASLVSVGCR